MRTTERGESCFFCERRFKNHQARVAHLKHCPSKPQSQRKGVFVSNIDQAIWNAAKRLAIETETPISRLVEDALRAYVSAHIHQEESDHASQS